MYRSGPQKKGGAKDRATNAVMYQGELVCLPGELELAGRVVLTHTRTRDAEHERDRGGDGSPLSTHAAAPALVHRTTKHMALLGLHNSHCRPLPVARLVKAFCGAAIAGLGHRVAALQLDLLALESWEITLYPARDRRYTGAAGGEDVRECGGGRRRGRR